MSFLDVEEYNDDYIYKQEKLQRKIQRLINAGISPERIRPDGTYVMTKEEFVNAVTKHIEKKKLAENKRVFSEQEELYMNYVFKKRKLKKKY